MAPAGAAASLAQAAGAAASLVRAVGAAAWLAQAAGAAAPAARGAAPAAEAAAPAAEAAARQARPAELAAAALQVAAASSNRELRRARGGSRAPLEPRARSEEKRDCALNLGVGALAAAAGPIEARMKLRCCSDASVARNLRGLV